MNGSRGWSPRGHLGRSRRRHGAPVPGLAGTRPGLGETVRARRPPTPPPAPAGNMPVCGISVTTTERGRPPTGREGAPGPGPHVARTTLHTPGTSRGSSSPRARAPKRGVHNPPGPGHPGALSSLGAVEQESRRLEFARKGYSEGEALDAPSEKRSREERLCWGGSIPKCLRGHRDDRRAGPASDRSRGSGGLASDPGCDCWLGHRQPGDLGPPPEAQDGPGTEGDRVTWVRETGSVVLGTWAAARQKEQSLILY